MSIREDWLDSVQEKVIEPDLVIVDPHHHFWKQRSQFPPYLLDDLYGDTGSGHRVKHTVFIECGAEYRNEGPVSMRPVGETEFVTELARQSLNTASAATVSGIVAHTDLSLGNEVEQVLQAHIDAGCGLVRGIRHHAVWDASPDVPKSRINPPYDLFQQKEFRAALDCLTRMGLSFDAWVYHTQLPQLAELARACPDTSIILNHLGTPIGVGPYAGRRNEILQTWKQSMKDLSRCPNVTVKLGGMAMLVNGFRWNERKRPPTSDELAESQRPYHLHAIDCFGPDRCMFESNFPIEKESVSYLVLWNALKKITAGFTDTEKKTLFAGTATQVYNLV